MLTTHTISPPATRCLLGMACLLFAMILPGCGTTKQSDTSRTATEQLLLSNAIDRSINNMDFQVLSGKEIFLDVQYLKGAVDENYIISSLRQHLLAHGCVLKEDRKEATYIVEARAGAVGTNRHDVLLGIPSVQVPAVPGVVAAAQSIPEIPFAKTTDQKGVAKIAVFAYNQKTGQPVWQSGSFPVAATAKDTWIFGSGPYQRGSIYASTNFAGSKLTLPFQTEKEAPGRKPAIPVTAEAAFEERPMIATKPEDAPTGPTPPAAGQPGAPAAAPAAQPAPAAGAPAGEPAPRRAANPGGPNLSENQRAIYSGDNYSHDGNQVGYATDEPDRGPAGYIIRLPPLDEVERPDLKAVGPPRQNRPGGARGQTPLPAASQAPPERAKFSIFSPSTWFGG